MVERRFSKTVANANHVVFTENEVIPVPYTLVGQAYDGAVFGTLRIRGREVQCIGLRVDVQTPSRGTYDQFSVQIFTGDGVAAGEAAVVSGNDLEEEKIFASVVSMPPGSVWQAKFTKLSGDDIEMPEGVTVTYLLRYANGPSYTSAYSVNLPGGNLGYWALGKDFVLN